MAHLVLMDKITKSLDDGENDIDIYLDFSKAFTLLIMIYYCKNGIITASGALHMNGFKLTWPTGTNMSLIMGYTHLLNRSNVVFPKDPFKNHSKCLW